jgi:APA family basic amino acid/polyamine antiporter
MKQAKQLTSFDLTIIMISFVIGMGIFRTPSNVANALNSPAEFFLVWIIGGLVAICGALTYAEIGSRMPVTGGYYKIFAYAYHPSIAFAINCIILVSNASSLGAVALIGSEYISGILIPQSRSQPWMAGPGNAAYVQTLHIVIAISAIVLFYATNLLGLKTSALVQNLLTIIKITVIVFLISPLFFVNEADLPAQTLTKAINNPTLLEYVKAFGIGLVAVSFTYGGYQQTINFGEEVRNPRKNIPKAIFYGMGIIIVLYLLINYTYVKLIGFEELKTTKDIAAIMAAKAFGPYAERILSVLLFLSVLAYVNVLLMSNPRVMAAMSEDNVLPYAFRKRNRKTEVLTTSLSIFSALCVLIIFWAKEFDTILSFTIFLDCFGMILSAGSIFIIRKKTAYLNDSGIYKMKLYPLLPIIVILAYTVVGASILVTHTNRSLVALAVLALFITIYFLIVAIPKKNTNN